MAGLIPPHKLEEIRAASDIVEVVGSYVPLKRAGGNFVALCPFHKEKSPSFNVSPARQSFHCFGCHKGGDVFTFVKEYENIGFMDAVRRLAERARIPLEFEDNPAFAQSRQLKDRLLDIHEQITQRWQTALANDTAGQIARDYLAKRGVSEEAVKLFRLGCAPDAWDDTVNWARGKGHEAALIEQAGLIIRKEGSDRYYDRFRGRLMFPICDEQGRVVAFSGRVLSGDEKTAKYVNSPETPIFTKGKILYALDKAKRSILDSGYAIVCEGQLDAIACHSGGVTNVVAPQGTALTVAHANILRRYTKDIVLCFDGDKAGQRAAARSFDELIESGIPLRVVSIPNPDDPDSYIKKHGRDNFLELVFGAPEFFDFYLKFLCSQYDVRTDRGRQEILQLMAAALHKTNKPTLVDVYAERTALRLAVSPDSVRAEFRNLAKAKVIPREPDAVDDTVLMKQERPSAPEFWLLKLMLLRDESVPWLQQHLELEWITNATVRGLIDRRLTAARDSSWNGASAMLAGLEDPLASSLVSEALVEERELPETIKQMSDTVMKLRNQFIDRRLIELTQRASHPDIGEDERMAAMREQQQLRQLKRQPVG